MARFGVLEVFIIVLLLIIMPFGMMMVALGKTRETAARSGSTNNLRQIGLAFHNFSDTMGFLPFNGGHLNPDKLKAVNYGWHNANVRDSGTWATMILPFIEQDPLYRNLLLTATANDALPAWLTDNKNAAQWQITLRNYICPGRGRAGFKTDTAKGCYPGIVTDYAINVFLNSPPKEYTKHGFALNGGVPIEENTRLTIQGIADGSNNTVLVGGKALPPAVQNSNKATEWDEGLFSPGNYKADNEKSTLTSTGTGRGHTIDPMAPNEDVKARPKTGGVAWMYRDSELIPQDAAKKITPEYAMDWGGPFAGGVLFLWGDGTVRIIRYNSRGTVNFARMLYPNDGQVITFD